MVTEPNKEVERKERVTRGAVIEERAVAGRKPRK